MATAPEGLVRALADRYRIEGEVGAGGMATVHLAEDLRHGRRVAIKVLRPELVTGLGPDRFAREIEIAARLTHPHILPLHDSGTADGHLYYVMPFIEGESLRDRLESEGALPVADAVRFFREIVDALGAAHARGVVHRDVKPGNVLLADGHALVSDFGVAKALTEAAGERKATTLGVAIGTLEYMSPEQAGADPATDHRSDLFAAGVIAYEMLTGVSPHAADTVPGVVAALMTRIPEHPSRLRKEVPEPLGDVVLWCLEKDPADRPASAAALLARLDAATAGVTPSTGAEGGRGRIGKGFWTRRRSAAAVVAVVGAALATWLGLERRAEVRWARQEALPEVLRLAGEGEASEAADLAFRVEAVLGSDPVLDMLWQRITSPIRIVTEPPGAEVAFRPYAASDTGWVSLGTTPIERDRFPVGAFRFRIELDGYDVVELARSFISTEWLGVLKAAGFDYLTDPSYAVDLRLTPAGSGPPDMVRVTGGTYTTVPIFGFGQVDPIEIPSFWIDRTEVTNEAYRQFVDAGAYADSTFWSAPFVRDGRPVDWRTVVASLVDGTGRPGPSTWVLGRPPEERESYPVGGVSWYEAAAYCAWRGKSLPTLFHWARAAVPSADAWAAFHPSLAAASNLQSEGPLPVGARDAIGATGAQDLAGNVREWVWTPSGENRHFAGGGWNDPGYAARDLVVASPWTRLATDGFRCARWIEGESPEHLQRSIELPDQDLFDFTAMPDEVFEATIDLFTYDHDQPLAVEIDSTRVAPTGVTVEWVSVDAPYGERLPMRVHVPDQAEPPYGAVVFFPGSDMLFSRAMGPPQLAFLAQAGWVLVEPVFAGGFQRNDGRTLQRLQSPGSRTTLYSQWVQDLGRAIDYLEQRGDVDGGSVAYAGLSLGAAAAAQLLPYEPRVRGAVLLSGGLSPQANQESLDRLAALAGRIRIPVLMAGGRDDFANPVSHQEALFRAIGTPDERKTLRTFDAAHWPLPMNELIRETVDFLDRYVAPQGG